MAPEVLQVSEGEPAEVLLEHQWPSDPLRQPARVYLSRAAESLRVWAQIPDLQVVSSATGPNQRMWLLGDTFEMFFQPEVVLAYTELHVTPDNHRLQLRIPSQAYFQEARQERDAFEEFLLPDPMFTSIARRQENGGWSVFAEIRGAFIQGDESPLLGRRWRYSFCRYDYDELPGEPVLSSTSPHAVLDFHRLEDWRLLEFV